MWLLESLTKPGVRFHLLVGEDYQVGRKDCRIVISKDQSVSRKHGMIRVNHSEAHLSKPSLPSTVTLQDSSKYGSLVNGSQMDLGSSVTLKHGDQVSFGATNSNEWKLTYKPLVVAFSSIPSPEKKLLKTLVLKLGGHVVSEWNKDCTHLTMTQLSVTIKVTAALITCRPIITPQYLHSMKDAAQNDKDMPNFSNFRPPVVEEAVDTKEVNFDPNPARSTLFKDKSFIFVAQKQFKQLGPTIELGGGKIILMQEGDTETFSSMTASQSIVMYADPDDITQAPTQDTQDWIREVMQHLKRHSLRPIPVSELGLAVLYASTQLHCNPKVGQAGLNLLNAAPSQTAPRPQVLVSDTQASCAKQTMSDTGQRSSTRQQKVPGSSSSEDERSKAQQQTKKRGRQDSAPEITSKIPKLEPPSPITESSSKSSKIEVAETPQKSSESLPSLPSLKTSPEFSFVGKPQAKATHPIKEEVVSPPSERNNNKQAKGCDPSQGQRSDPSQRSLVGEEEKMEMDSDNEEPVVAYDKPASSKSKQMSGNEKKKNKTATLDSDNEEPVAVTAEDEPASSKFKAEQTNGNKKKKNKTATLDSIWDVEVGSRRRKKKVKEEMMVEEEKEEEAGGDQVDVETKSEEMEEDSQNSMWKRKRKRNVLDQIAAEEVRESQLSQGQDGDEQEEVDNKDEVMTDAPEGFVTATKKEEAIADHQIKSEANAELEKAYAVVCVTAEALVIRKPKPKKTNSMAVIGKTNVKNFKRFKKAGYAGQNRMPTIIGGRDLEEHTNKPNEEIDDMMFGGHQQQQRRAKDDELADRLFADEPRKQKPARGRRR